MADVPARLKAILDDLRQTGPAPGRAWCVAWTQAVDEALSELAAPALERGRLTLAAVGGYGRRELCPGSDVDLLVLHDHLDDRALEASVKDVVYPLWDAGLKVGYAVRTIKQAAGMADDLDSATATLDARRIAGDAQLLSDARTALIARLRRRPARFLTQLTQADGDRRRRSGDAAEVLEPDLKSGAGGLRDVQSLRWAGAALVGETGLDPLVSAGYIGAPDRSRLARAYDRLLGARVALHLTQERTETLRLDLQDGVAARLGYEDGADDRDTAAHRLLRDLFLAARTVDHVHRRAWSLVLADAATGRRRRRAAQRMVDGFEILDGVVRLAAGSDVNDPDLPVRLLAVLVDENAVLDRTTAAALRRLADSGQAPWRWNAATRRRFLDVLWRGSVALPALAELDDVGVLVALLPEWEPIRGRAQRNPFHRYSLDRHAWHAAAALGDLVQTQDWAMAELAHVSDRDGLLLGVWLHDVGKAHGEPHSETGIPVAQAVARRIGADDQTVELVGVLVRHHLLLPDSATRGDVADAALAHQVAAMVGDRSTLACLNLLSVADGQATGPSAWTTWKATLVASLVMKVEAVLEERHPDEVADGASATTRDAEDLAPALGVDRSRVRDHLAVMPERYATAVSPRAVVRHAAMTAEPLEPGELRTRVTPGEEPGEYEGYDTLDLAAHDAPGLFAKVAGVLALHGGSVVTADAFISREGLAVDTFTVEPPEHASGSWWVRVEGDLAEAAAGRLALRARVQAKARGEQRRIDRLPEMSTRVSTALDPAGRSTVLEVHTLDRLGVLYAITSALSELRLDIVVARIQTMGHEVVDVFFLRDTTGEPLDDDHAAEVRLAVEAALEP